MEGQARHSRNTHVDSISDEFCKLLLPSAGLDVRRIPGAFLPTFNGVYPQTIKLKICKSCSWDVNLKEVDANIIMDEGWLDFVKAHDLQIGYFLVFKKLDATTFKVIVFGHDKIEKVITCAGYH